ncbi:ENTH-domain-containing protein [Ramicandelaber brevisporus]|nr:ENTH-domain-containing protein [Ramicandelaber brevisporus]
MNLNSLWGEAQQFYTKARNAVLQLTEMEIKVNEATSNEPWGASRTLMLEIASHTSNPQYFGEIMPAIYHKLSDTSSYSWRQTYKALQLLEYLVKNGAERVVDDARNHLPLVKGLRTFAYIDGEGKDQGLAIRQRSKELSELLQNVSKIREERKLAKLNRGKYGGVSNETIHQGASFKSGEGFGGSGKKYGGFGSDSIQSSSRYDADDTGDDSSPGLNAAATSTATTATTSALAKSSSSDEYGIPAPVRGPTKIVRKNAPATPVRTSAPSNEQGSHYNGAYVSMSASDSLANTSALISDGEDDNDNDNDGFGDFASVSIQPVPKKSQPTFQQKQQQPQQKPQQASLLDFDDFVASPPPPSIADVAATAANNNNVAASILDDDFGDFASVTTTASTASATTTNAATNAFTSTSPQPSITPLVPLTASSSNASASRVLSNLSSTPGYRSNTPSMSASVAALNASVPSRASSSSSSSTQRNIDDLFSKNLGMLSISSNGSAAAANKSGSASTPKLSLNAMKAGIMSPTPSTSSKTNSDDPFAGLL